MFATADNDSLPLHCFLYWQHYTYEEDENIPPDAFTMVSRIIDMGGRFGRIEISPPSVMPFLIGHLRKFEALVEGMSCFAHAPSQLIRNKSLNAVNSVKRYCD